MEQATEVEAGGAHDPHTLLLVDDEENILAALRRLLRRDGYRILCATSGKDGLALLEKEPNVDIIMSDQRMPHMTGTAFLRQARNLSPDSIRIVLSGYTDLESVTEAINEGAVYKFLTKPWDDEILRLSIKEALQFKWTTDENRILQSMMVEVNQEFAASIEKQNVQLTDLQSRLDLQYSLISSLPVPALVVAPNATIVQASHAAQTLFGFAGDTLPVAAAQLDESLAAILDSTTPPQGEFSFGGKTFHYLSSAADETTQALRILLFWKVAS